MSEHFGENDMKLRTALHLMHVCFKHLNLKADQTRNISEPPRGKTNNV